MLNPDLIGYMFLFPVVVFFGLPFLLLPLILLLKKRAAGTRQAVEQRGWPRQKIEGAVAYVSDGVHCSRAKIKNISEHGICFTCPPDGLNKDTEKLAVLLTGAGKNFQLEVRPKWKALQSTEQSIGGAISDCLGKWDELAGFTGRAGLTRSA